MGQRQRILFTRLPTPPPPSSERLRVSRSSITAAGQGGGGKVADDDAPLLLGCSAPSGRFSFAADAPVPLQWCRSAAAARGSGSTDVEGVVTFIVAALGG